MNPPWDDTPPPPPPPPPGLPPNLPDMVRPRFQDQVAPGHQHRMPSDLDVGLDRLQREMGLKKEDQPGLVARKAKEADRFLYSLIPPGWRPMVDAIGEFGANFNSALADTLGWAPDTVDKALRGLGMRIYENPGAGTRAVREFMAKDLGVPVQRTSTLEGQAGRAAFEGLLSAAALFKAASIAANAGNATKAQRFLTGVAEFIKNHPWLVSAQEIGAALGANIMQDEGADAAGIFLGAAAGSFAPQTAVGMAKMAAAPVRWAGRKLGLSGDPPTPLVTPGSHIAGAQSAVATARQAEVAGLEAGRQAELVQAGGPMYGRVGEASEDLVKGVQTSREVVREALENRHFGNFQALTVETKPMFDDIRRYVMSLEPSARRGHFPSDTVKEMMDLYIRKKGRRTIYADTSVRDLLNLRSDIQAEAALAAKGSPTTVPDQKKAAHLYALSDIILDNVRGQLAPPTVKLVEDALSAARKAHDLFDRGPVGRVLYSTQRRELGVPPGQAVERMLSSGDPKAFAQIPEIEKAGTAAVKYTLHPPPLSALNTTEKAERAIRALFAQAAERDPTFTGAKWLENNRAALGAMSRLVTDLSASSERLAAIHARLKEMEQDAVAKFIRPEGNPFASLIAQGPNAIREVKATLQGNAAAIRGFQAGVIDHILHASQGRPLAIRDMLTDPTVYRAVQEALDTSFPRFLRIVNSGAALEAGTVKSPAARMAKRGMVGTALIGLGAIEPVYAAGAVAVPFLFRFLGAHTGSTISNIVGRGNIQVPAFMSNIFHNWALDTFRGITPAELTTRAILDPRWEAVLMRKSPENFAELRKFAKTVRRLAWAGQGAMHSPMEVPDE